MPVGIGRVDGDVLTRQTIHPTGMFEVPQGLQFRRWHLEGSTQSLKKILKGFRTLQSGALWKGHTMCRTCQTDFDPFGACSLAIRTRHIRWQGLKALPIQKGLATAPKGRIPGALLIRWERVHGGRRHEGRVSPLNVERFLAIRLAVIESNTGGKTNDRLFGIMLGQCQCSVVTSGSPK